MSDRPTVPARATDGHRRWRRSATTTRDVTLTAGARTPARIEMKDNAPISHADSSFHSPTLPLIVLAWAGVRIGTGGWAVILAFGLPLVAAVL